MKAYEPAVIEPKWQTTWANAKQHETPNTANDKENYLVLTEFPYPSGNLHIGHWYAFALPDIHARFLRMQGSNVLYPIGFDAFGLPAENAAIARGINPKAWTQDNITYMTTQLESMGASFDWSRVISTIDPEYYRWTQWMFLKMYEKGLAYRAKTVVNWCPQDKTVLANEQVVNELCERCDTPVVQKEIEQWMFKITAYADRLVDELQDLDWPETTKLAQRNWIGRSEGASIKFYLTSVPGQTDKKHFVEVFTTRVDTIFGATAVVVSPELAQTWLDVGWSANDRVKEYVEQSLAKRELDRLEQAAEKTGVPTGISAINPVNNKKVPVWVAAYVLGHYGTGAVMLVPAHDERDFEFAKEFHLPCRCVIDPTPAFVAQLGDSLEDAEKKTLAEIEAIRAGDKVYIHDGTLINSSKYSGLTSAKARQIITRDLKKHDGGEPKKTYRLHDWVLSRQRYWGVPIPMTICATCGYRPVREEELPVELPALENYLPTDEGKSPLAKAGEWVNVACSKCGGAAKRETDTMDTFVDSSWYFMRYTDPHNAKKFAEPKKMKSWLPVPLYLGGAEHNTMHLLYARFFTKVLFDLGYIHFAEPFLKRINRGVILGPDGQKMSKSRGNVVDPDIEVKNFGADTVRLYLSFMGPYEHGGPWDPHGIHGIHRFLKRVWKLVGERQVQTPAPEASEAVRVAVQQTIKKVGEDLAGLQFNTAVSALMKLLNTLEEEAQPASLPAWVYETLLLLLAPLAPHITEELWHEALGKKSSVHEQPWPAYDEALLASQRVKIPVQVNGKVRATLEVDPQVTQEEISALARALPNVARYLNKQVSARVVYVPGRLINFVVT